MNAFVLKLIAITAMTIDHIGYVFFPYSTWMRVAGRLTMPIFAFLISEGFRHTKNIDKYIKRMFVLALISAVPFFLLFKTPSDVLFAYLFALLGLKGAQHEADKRKKVLKLLGFAVLSLVFVTDWPLVAPLMVYVFYYANYDKRKIFLGFTSVFFICYGIFYLVCVAINDMGLFLANNIQFGLFLALPIIFLYNGTQGPKAKYLFYWYYPLHLFAIWIIDILL